MTETASSGASEDPGHLFLIDGSGFIFRAFHALPPMNRGDGVPVNAVYGFTNMLLKVLKDTDADHVAVIFDAARRTFRNDIYPAYKAHRPETPPELVPQFALIREAVRAFNVPAVEMEGFEADDLIATYARLGREAGWKVTIMSSDKDLMQLVGGPVEMFDPIRNRRIGPDEVTEKFLVPPNKVVDVQSLIGDPTDNVPGVPGIGVKTAAQLIDTFGDLDSLLARAAEIPQPKRRQTLIDFADQARLSRDLVRLEDAVPVESGLEALAVREADPSLLSAFLAEQGFKSILLRLQKPAGAPVAGTKSTPAATPPKTEPAPAPGIDRSRYELVQDEARLAAWIERATASGLVAVDTETTSLDATRAELVGVSLALSPGEACYIPLGHRRRGETGGSQGGLDFERVEALRQIPRQRAIEMLKPLLEDEAVLKVGHNIKYDWVVLAGYGISMAPVDCTMLISYVLDGGLHGHGLDELSQLHLGHVPITYAEVTGTGKSRIGFEEVALETARDYAAEDADVCLALHGVLKPRLRAEHLLAVYEGLERPLVAVIAGMERQGVRVDATALKRLSLDFAQRMAALEEQIHALAGRPFNVGSPKQLGEVLFDELGLNGGKKGKTGAYATGADVLESLAETHDLPARVLDWRQLAKLKSTYADALVDQINPATGRVHTSYSMAATTTGRLSSSDPNLQNIPVRTEEGRKIREAFIAEPGWRLLSADYSQIELRLLAHVAGIDTLIEAFAQGADIHAMTASQVFGVPVQGMDPMLRRRAKAINFGIIYGISAFGLAKQLGIGQSEAASYIAAYFARYPGIRDYMEDTKAFCRTHHYVVTPFGRRIHMPGIKDSNQARRAFAERAAINAPLQGGAADIIKRAMIRLPGALAEAGLSARMLLQVHDELVFEVIQAESEATAALVKRVMEGVAELKVPLVVDTGFGDNWAQAH